MSISSFFSRLLFSCSFSLLIYSSSPLWASVSIGDQSMIAARENREDRGSRNNRNDRNDRNIGERNNRDAARERVNRDTRHDLRNETGNQGSAVIYSNQGTQYVPIPYPVSSELQE